MRVFPRTGKLISADLIAADFSIVPDEPGIYGWFFGAIPPRVPVEGCLKRGTRTLLYVGIAPRMRISGADKTKRTLRNRLRNHLAGNVKSSTLRMSLAALLKGTLGLAPARTPKGSLKLGEGEARLSSWLKREAAVVWAEHTSPWVLEDKLLQTLVLPLNLKGNRGNQFATELADLRRRLRSNGE